MCGRFYLDTMHVDHTNLIMRYLLIQWPNLKTGNTVATVRISRSFLWYVMNDMMHVIQIQNDACNARINWCMWCNYDFLGYMDGHSSNSPWLNHMCKIECLPSFLTHTYKCKGFSFFLFSQCHLFLSLPLSNALLSLSLSLSKT